MAKARLVKVIWLAILYLSFSIDLIAGFADFKLGSEPYGFRGIIWGTDISRLKDMKYLATKDGVKYYSRKGDLLKIGAAKLEIVAYGFWNDKFSEVLVKTDGFDNYNKLKDAIFDNYGEDDFIKLGWVKIFVDGSIGARTAYLREPYRDKPSKGILLKTDDELRSMIEELGGKGLKVALHAIGNGAIDVSLNAFEKANIKLRGHRIEHAEMIDSDQAKRAKEMDIILCVQPNFNPVFMETYIKALGENRARMMNPLKVLDKMGVSMIFSSDMMPFDPEVGLTYASQILGKEKALYYYGGWKNR